MAQLVNRIRTLFRLDSSTGSALLITDPVTHLPTRASIKAHLEATLTESRHKTSVALAIIEFSNISGTDLDDERVLQRQLAGLLRAWMPAEYLVGHLLDREFAIIFRGVPMATIQRLASEIVDKVRREPSLEGRQRQFVTIVGLGCASRGEGDASQLLALADIALQYAKSTGRGWHAIVDSAFTPRSNNKP
jgi:GGDEF domain-containing protein